MSARNGVPAQVRRRRLRSVRARMTLREVTALAALLIAAVAIAAVVLHVFAGAATGALVAVMALLAGACTGIAWWRVQHAVARALRPVRRLRANLIDVADSVDPGARVDVPATGDDVERLAGRVNMLLGRLETSAAQRRAFIADASHELRTPLTGLRTRIELALDDPDDGDLADNLRHALDDVERLHRIVEDLFVLARLDSGDLPERRPLDLGALVESEVAGLKSPVQVTVKAERGVVVMGNQSRLSRVLFNLLSNAERYAVAHIEVHARAVGEEAVVEVHDDGPGIQPDDRDRVFERFARLDAARSRDKGGSGLGLPIARQIAIAHGGTLYVANGTYGARLVLRLPLAR